MNKLRFGILMCSLTLLLSACANKEPELAPVELPTDQTDLSQCEYSVDMAEGAYGNFTVDDVKVTFFGINDYTLLEKEASKVKAGNKAVVVGMSAEKLRNNDAAIDSRNYILVDTMSNTQYQSIMVKDNDITQFEKVKEKTVMCYRLIYAVPEGAAIDGCVLLVKSEDGEEHIYSHAVEDEPSEDYVDKSNLCPICTEEEYEKTTLIVCECPICKRQFVSAHNPPQQVCYACSVMNNICTQCKRYITSGINRLESK